MKRTRHSADFKAKVALEASKEQNTLAELASKYKVHAVQISKWKQMLLDGSFTIFENRSNREDTAKQKDLDTAYKYIGELLVELDWIKKKLKRSL
ncbi:MAG: transposase [Chlamydiae bacterium]|jgi:transposase|nr:transposase [Chlamydiota bacterium]